MVENNHETRLVDGHDRIHRAFNNAGKPLLALLEPNFQPLQRKVRGSRAFTSA
jgi:hypothetical protein